MTPHKALTEVTKLDDLTGRGGEMLTFVFGSTERFSPLALGLLAPEASYCLHTWANGLFSPKRPLPTHHLPRPMRL